MAALWSKTCILATTLWVTMAFLSDATSASESIFNTCVTGLLEDGVVEISSTLGGMVGLLSVTAVGDVDGNGAADMVIGASQDDDHGAGKMDFGAVYLVLMEKDGFRLEIPIKMDIIDGFFSSNTNDQFGISVAGGVNTIGGYFDVDNDGMWDLVVGAKRGDGDGLSGCGAVYVVFMNRDYSVREMKRISHGQGGLGRSLERGGFFGTSVAVLVGEDLNMPTVAVGAPSSDGGRGAVYVLSLNNLDGTVETEKKIGLGQGNLQAVLDVGDGFGQALTAMDLMGNGGNYLVVGAQYDDDGYKDAGAVYVLSLDSQGDVLYEKKISATVGGLKPSSLESNWQFGSALTELGDLDGDGVVDLAVMGGAYADDGDNSGGSENRGGAVHVLLLNDKGGVKTEGKKVVTTAVDLEGGRSLGPGGFFFGSGLAKLGGKSITDGVLQLAVGATWYASGDEDGDKRGAVFVLSVPSLFVDPCDVNEQCIMDGASSYTCVPFLRTASSSFKPATGSSHAPPTSDGLARELEYVLADVTDTGCVYEGPLEVEEELTIGSNLGGLGALPANGFFGRSVVALGDMDGDGVEDLAVGGGLVDGESFVYILFMNANDTVRVEHKIDSTAAGLDDADLLGHSLAVLGDLDGDGVVDLAAGARGDDDGGTTTRSWAFGRGAVYIFFLNADGTVKGEQKLSATQGGLTGLSDNDQFGGASTAGDLNGDGRAELVMGVPLDDTAVDRGGAVHVLFLNANGTVDTQKKITAGLNGMVGPLSSQNHFGYSVEFFGDLDGDTVPDLAVGAPNDFDGGTYRQGALYIFLMNADGSVKGEKKISVLHGGLKEPLAENAYFGYSLAAVGDLNGDGEPDLAVGSRHDGGDGTPGAITFLLMNADGSVKVEEKIETGVDGVPGPLASTDFFSMGLSSMDGRDDGLLKLAVTAPGLGDGVVYILEVSHWFMEVCEEDCTNVDGGYTCSCSTPGYGLLEGDGRSCVDIDECAFGTDLCDEGCTNTDGSYTCSCSTPGLDLAVDGFSCVADIDECVEGTDLCEEDCTNTVGGYTCSCSTPGYELDDGDGLACVDIDECVEGTDLCEEDCTNTVGGYTCSCSTPGYELDDGDGFACVDIDECADETDQCEEDCTNTVGNYTCSCSTRGLKLDVDGDGFACVDIDECVEGGAHLCEEVCTNTDGSYTCSCSTPGLELAGDGYGCLADTSLAAEIFRDDTGTVLWVVTGLVAAFLLACVVAVWAWRRYKRGGTSSRWSNILTTTLCIVITVLYVLLVVFSARTQADDDYYDGNDGAFYWVEDDGIVWVVIAGFGTGLLLAVVAAVWALARYNKQKGGPPSSSTVSDEKWHVDPAEVEIGAALGEGFFGTTYKAQWRGEDVVVKKFKSGVREKGDEEANFWRELNILSTLRHPRIVQFLGASVQADNMFLVMELMRGGSLKDMFSRPLEEEGSHQYAAAAPATLEQHERKWLILRDIARGMLYLHQQQPVVLHRDLNSGNVLLDHRWRAKVADFGVSKVLVLGTNPSTPYNYLGGGPQGHIAYAAPEMFQGGRSSVASDVYSFAVVAWELFAELPPHYGMSVPTLAREMVTEGIRPSLEALDGGAPYVEILRPQLEQWWDRDPAKRPSFEQILKALDEEWGIEAVED